MNDEEEKLDDLKRKLSEKQKEVKELKDRIKDVKDGLRKNGVSFSPSRVVDLLEKLSSDDTVLAEECGASEIFSVDLYLIKDGETVYLGRRPGYEDRRHRRYRSSRVRSPERGGVVKFIKEEVEPVREHEHEGGLTHRTWLLTGDELRIFKRLISDFDLSRLYYEEGWQGLKEYYRELKGRYEKKYPTFSSPERVFSYPTSKRYGLRDMRVKLMDYAGENDLTLKEAVAGLKLENPKFAERYEESKSSLLDEMRWIEDLLSEYTSVGSYDNEGYEKEVE